MGNATCTSVTRTLCHPTLRKSLECHAAIRKLPIPPTVAQKARTTGWNARK
uniref:Uncharacterized protein n=1 Tax=Setaria digitata TaxID=48799 RepID=A0A915PGW2_9BILA